MCGSHGGVPLEHSKRNLPLKHRQWTAPGCGICSARAKCVPRCSASEWHSKDTAATDPFLPQRRRPRGGQSLLWSSPPQGRGLLGAVLQSETLPTQPAFLPPLISQVVGLTRGLKAVPVNFSLSPLSQACPLVNLLHFQVRLDVCS